ncbi:MAG: nucleotidyl transferase AbiEii/AbiGii toxin family protein [Candidatus Micrarchaeota archaeon]
MKELERKNQLALEIARQIFQKKIDVIFIGGTALNSFYLDYRYSEDIDLGYIRKSPKHEIEKLLRECGYQISKTNFSYRDIVSFDGIQIKMDIIEYKKKYNGIIKKLIGDVNVKTLEIEEFMIDKTICFFTRENMIGMARDGYDLFYMQQKYGFVLDLATKAKKIIRKEIVSIDFNIDLFQDNLQNIEYGIAPYLKTPINAKDVLVFLKRLRGVLNE